ncbi:polyprenol phosphomannose-dependent alpha 1,6 mannosyltransferase MptB [Acaricomes phytoseiuli]|uniref:polyprenol phosphomannose-dependent alpha 1,6 mannosyltransferase MptB n=1 Tax=Acaricomes phytoseiuli TaxID=291968 RepID=UPI00036A1053|nr:polyprenol phosphomannose-dependent alpha 1,6 mannosyltransferase MptB [Acaricomes phytoseiuli]
MSGGAAAEQRSGAVTSALRWLKSLWTVPPPDGVNQPAHWAIWQGFVGSLFMTIGSFGTGWLNVSSPLTRNPFFIAMRTEGWGVTISTLLLAFGAMLLVRSWLRLGQRLRYWGREALRPVVWALVAWSLPLFFAVPIYSRDVYAYNGQGRLMVENINPYEQGIAALNNWFQLGADPMWSATRTPYGPYFLWMERWVVQLSGGDADYAVLLFRLLAVAGMAMTAYYVYKVAQLHHIDGGRAIWIAVANPLSIISFVASAHNDSLMVGFALAAVYYTAKGKWALGIVMACLSIGIKPITVIILPFIGLLWAGKGASWSRKILCWIGTAAGTALILGLSGLVYDLGWGWIKAILDPTPGFIAYTPSGFTSNIIASITSSLGLDGGSIADGFRGIVKWVGVLIAVVLIFRGDDSKVIRRLGLAFAAIVMLNAIIQPWYVLWFIPFLAATGIRNDWQIKSWYIVVVFFVVFGAQDQLNIWQFVNTPVEPATITAAVTFLFVLYLLLLDPKTRRLLVHFQAPAEHKAKAAATPKSSAGTADDGQHNKVSSGTSG